MRGAWPAWDLDPRACQVEDGAGVDGEPSHRYLRSGVRRRPLGVAARGGWVVVKHVGQQTPHEIAGLGLRIAHGRKAAANLAPKRSSWVAGGASLNEARSASVRLKTVAMPGRPA